MAPAEEHTRAVPIPWRALGVEAAKAWAATRIALVLVTYLVVSFFGQPRSSLVRRMLESWSQWDTHWYLLISRLGYFHPIATNFFPLYPKLVAALMVLAGDAHGPVWPALDAERLGAALVVSNLGALAALIALAWLAWQETGSLGAARLALVALLAYPVAFFLAAAYAESTFVALAALLLLFARQGRWLPAAACGMLAALDRPVALALMVPLALEFADQHGWLKPPLALEGFSWRLVGEVGLVLAAVPAGFAIYMAYLWRRFGDPLLFAHTQLHYWHHAVLPPWQTAAHVGSAIIRHRGTPEGAMALVDLGVLVAVVALTVWSARRQPISFTAYTLVLALLTVVSPLVSVPDAIQGSSRYLLGAIPVWLMLGRLMSERPWLTALYVGSGAALQAVICLAFLSGRFGIF